MVEKKPLMPSDAKSRKAIPIATGVLDYFPSALIEIAKVSQVGNDQHNPGQSLHWARGKSTDQADTSVRHFMERTTNENGEPRLTVDVDGMYHMAKACWRMLAEFQVLLEAEGAPLARGARLPEKK